MAKDLPLIGRAPPARPPPGYRPPIPKRIKDQVHARQGGLCNCGCGQPVARDKAQFDHRPALYARGWDGDTIPPANDPLFIEALIRRCHDKRTKRDITEYAKGRRIERREAEHQAQMRDKRPGQPRQLKGTIRSRGFEKRGAK